MKIYILIILSFIFINKHSKGQVSQDTIYFNKDWDKVCHNNAKYYRIIEKLNTHFIVRDYYINEQLQMVGSYISINPEIKDGEFTWYKKNGKVLSVGHYINNMANGSFMSFRKNGNIFLKETYINDTLNGILTYWKRDGTFDFAVEYCKGKHDTSYASFKYIYFYSIAFIDSIFKMYLLIDISLEEDKTLLQIHGHNFYITEDQLEKIKMVGNRDRVRKQKQSKQDIKDKEHIDLLMRTESRILDFKSFKI